MKDMKTVLIALDYNPTAKKVAETGYSLAKSLKAKVILLHVFADPTFYATSGFDPIMGYEGFVDVSPTVLESTEGLKDASLQYLDKTRQYLGDDEIQILVNEGDIAKTILSTAKDQHADVIVMGSHSQRWLENIVMGSVTEKVVNKSPVPLFIIPTRKAH
jgi:nucleotide-binding universal stress UspA family protein